MMKRTIKLNARETLTATLQIQRLAGNASGYFSLTGEIRDSRRRRDDGIVACGCLHNEILKAWPDLADAVALHLSDEDGAPMWVVAKDAPHSPRKVDGVVASVLAAEARRDAEASGAKKVKRSRALVTF